MDYPKIALIIFFLMVLSDVAFSQSIDVKSFQRLPNDQTARVHHPVTDQNGEKCALIKVVTTQKGFVWEGGTLGITKVESKTAEIWVYVPRGSKKITIKHDQLGMIRDYHYPEAIKEATVYEMVLTTGKVTTVVEEKEIPSQWLVINSEPTGANVFINDKLAGTTPFQRKYKEGEYTYRLEKPRYHNKAGQVRLEDEKGRLDLTLKPQFGNLQITSESEDGMQIYLDDENTGKTTPATLEEVASGEHSILLNSKWYQPKTKKVTVRDEQTTTIAFNLVPAFANVSVTTQPKAEIVIDNQTKGTGSWNGRLLEGIYTIKAQKEKYHSQSEQLEVIAGKDETLNFTLTGKTGSADIVTNPMDARVYLNGKNKGTSPLTLDDLLIGSYELRLEKKGYGIIKKTLTIQIDETLTVSEKLPEGKNVVINSKPEGVSLYINGNEVGKTPYEATIGFGNKKIKFVNEDRIREEKINITSSGENNWIFEVYTNKGSFTDERDGKSYKWVQIGNQVWMAENLAYDTGWGCWSYDENERNVSKYGYLYRWETAKKACPEGWRLPSNDEWSALIDYIKSKGYNGDEGYVLKAETGWKDNGNGADKFNFKALPGGMRHYREGFKDIKSNGYWWSSTERVVTALRIHISYYSSKFKRLPYDKDYGFSVRCLRDD